MAKKTIKPKKPDWTPKLSGDLYCSPACGGGCTRKEYDAAMAVSQGIARRLGEGWAARVWENLGWHASAAHSSGLVTVYPNYRGVTHGRVTGYYVCLSVGGKQFTTDGRTPKDAIRKALEIGFRYGTGIMDDVHKLNADLRLVLCK